MKESLLSSFSSYGRYIPKPIPNEQSPNNSSNLYSITLKQNYTHERPFNICKFDIQGTNKLYLIDSVGNLIQLSVYDQTFSSLKNKNITNLQIDNHNFYNLIVSTKNHELHKVNFENKKTTKITNLQITKLLSFQQDYLRDILLVLDYKVLFLHDLASPGKIKSLKAIQNQIFTSACLGPSNRFLILAVKGIQIRFLQIMNLKTIHSIKLPFTIKNLKMQVSIHQKKVAIYGNCPVIFFINYTEKEELAYELIQLPFLKQVKQIQFLFEDILIVLGSDQIIYGISPIDRNFCKIIRLFNPSHVRIKAFDVSLDGKTMAVLSNRTVYIAKWENGVNEFLQNANDYREIDIVKDGFKYKAQEQQIKNQDYQNKANQYEDEQSEEEQEEIKQNNDELKDISLMIPKDIKTNYQFQPIREELISLPSEYQLLDQPNISVKNYVFQLVNQLQKAIPQLKNVYQSHECLLVGLVYSCYKLTAYKEKSSSFLKCFNFAYVILSTIVQCQRTKIQQYGLVFCPQIVSIVNKRFNQDFAEFFHKELTKLYIDYFDRTNWIQLIQFILNQQDYRRSDSLILVFILCLKKIGEKCGGDWSKLLTPTEFTKNILSLPSIITQICHIEKHEKYRHLFNTEAELAKTTLKANFEKEINNRVIMERDSNLQQLMVRQQAIRIALINLRERKPQ